MQKDERLIIEVSGAGYPDYEAVNNFFNGNGELECVYTNGKEGRSLSIEFDYNFVYINQKEYVTEIVKNIVNNTNKTKICIVAHKTGNPIEKVNAGVEKSKNKGRVICLPKEFYHESSELLWENGLKPFVVESIGCKFKDYQKHFDNLWNMLAPSQLEEVHSLRFQIITPFVVLHLALQEVVENKNDAFISDCKTACEAINVDMARKHTKLSELAKSSEIDIGKHYRELKDKIAELYNKLKSEDAKDLSGFKDLYKDKNSGNGLIGDFAEELEKVVEAAWNL